VPADNHVSAPVLAALLLDQARSGGLVILVESLNDQILDPRPVGGFPSGTLYR